MTTNDLPVELWNHQVQCRKTQNHQNKSVHRWLNEGQARTHNCCAQNKALEGIPGKLIVACKKIFKPLTQKLSECYCASLFTMFTFCVENSSGGILPETTTAHLINKQNQITLTFTLRTSFSTKNVLALNLSKSK